MKAFNIYLTGVGGQGIGLLSQALLRGIDHAGLKAVAVDTHGLAQRGGVVVSRIRFGSKVFSPLTFQHDSDIILGMEIHEAMRGLNNAAKDRSILVYLDVSWQPLPVRLGEAETITGTMIETECERRKIRCFRVDPSTIPDARMQNMALLGTTARNHLIPGVDKNCYRKALEDLLEGTMLKNNLNLFERFAQT